MKKKIAPLLPLIGIVLFIFIIWRTGISDILSVFPNINFSYLLLVPMLLFIIFLLKGLKWKIILNSLGINYSLWKSCKVWYIGFFIGSITPAKLGDFLRIFYIKRDSKKKIGECFLTVFLDRIFDIATILLLALASILIFLLFFDTNQSIGLIIAVIMVLLFAIYLSTKKNIVKVILKPFFNILMPKKYKKDVSLNFHKFYDSLKIVKKKILFITSFTTLITWFFSFLYAYSIALALNLNVSIGYIFLIMPLVILVELIPISISGLGTREAALIFFFSLIGISQKFAVSFSLLYIIGGWILALVGAIFWFKDPIKLR